MTNHPLDQTIRNYIYSHFVAYARPPATAETAAALGLEIDAVKAAYRRLHHNHAIFLEPDSPEPQVRMANPFSAAPTGYRVHTPSNTYWANCVWDMFGIPAALGCAATIEAACADCGQVSRIQVAGGQIMANDELAHFLLPFRQWYDDLLLT